MLPHSSRSKCASSETGEVMQTRLTTALIICPLSKPTAEPTYFNIEAEFFSETLVSAHKTTRYHKISDPKSFVFLERALAKIV
jgi:hypothetical protein